MLLKFRNNVFGPFTHYSVVPDTEIKRCVGPITPIDQVQFKFEVPIPEDLRVFFNNRIRDEYMLNIRYDFYYVEGGNIVLHSNGALFFFNHNITHFKIGNNDFQPIENIQNNNWCRFDQDSRLFQPLGGANIQFAITSEEEIAEYHLERIE